MPKKQVREQAKEPVDILAQLEGETSAPVVATKKEKASKRPVVELTDKGEIKTVELFAAAHGIEAQAKGVMENIKPKVQEIFRKAWAKIAFAAKFVPENPAFKTPNASITFQMVSKWKITVPSGQTPEQALVAAGLSAGKARILAAEVQTHTETTITPLQELRDNAETKPLFDKIAGFIGTLSPEERARVFVTTKKHEASGEFLQAAVRTCSGLEELQQVAQVVNWQERLSPVKYMPGFDEALKTMLDEEPAEGAKTTKTTTVKTVQPA